MTWLVFGVSCLLVLAGAVSVISGAPIIQLERGWAEVIAGTVALSSGGIVFALAAILMRVESLRDAIATDRSTSAPRLAPVNEPAESESLPAVPTHDLPASASSEQVTELVANDTHHPEVDEESDERNGLWKRVRRPDPTARPRPEPVGIPVPLPVRPADPVKEQAVAIPGAPALSAHPEAEAAPSPTVVPTVADAEVIPADDRPEEQTLGWLDRSLFRPRPKPVETRDPEPVTPALPSQPSSPLASPRVEPSLTADTSPPDAAAEPAAPVSPASDPGHEPEAAAEDVTVIGRYQAGVASYIMYSDGTIQVETEGGELHRFASMEELKAYIASQDNPVA